jgi:hypothetical protein
MLGFIFLFIVLMFGGLAVTIMNRSLTCLGTRDTYLRSHRTNRVHDVDSLKDAKTVDQRGTSGTSDDV